MKNTVYLIGSLRNPQVRGLAEKIRSLGFDVFDDWHAAGEKADDIWMEYEKGRRRTYYEALQGCTANHTFSYDLHHLHRAALGVLLLPAGKSAHLEFGYLLGQGKPGYMYMPEEPERWDVMVKFATDIALSENSLLTMLEKQYLRMQ